MFDTLSEKFSDAFKTLKGQSKITESNIEQTLKVLRAALLEADVNFKVVRQFLQQIKEKSLGEKVIKGINPGEQFIKIVHDELTQLMGDAHREIDFSSTSPLPVLIVGLNGAGKTTFTGKLALYLKSKKKKNVYLIPADNFRPAAKDQLIVHAKSLGVDYFDSDLSCSPLEIVSQGMKKAAQLGKEVVLIDTAGRLQVDEELMQQLVQVRQSLKNPEVLLVADAMTGQEAVNVAQTFHQRVQLTGAVLSKMDSDARGGAALSIKYVTQVPIRFMSVGEKMNDLEAFHPDRLAKRMLDMGDVVTLVEKAQDVVDEQEAEKMMKKMEKNQFTIADFIKQMDMISKLGSMESILKMIPGMGGMMRQVGDLSGAQGEMDRIKVMVNSMTPQERENHQILNESRRKRIARGSGCSEQQVGDFLQKFEQMRKMIGPMMSMMKGGSAALPGMPGGGARAGFRQAPGEGKKNKKGKGRSPFGRRFF